MGSTPPLRVMILTLSFGSGHLRAARAVADAVRAEDPDADVRCVDALERCRWFFRALYVWPYWLMVRHARWLWARLFSTRLTRVHRHTAPAWLFRAGCPRVFADIDGFRPDVIVAVEVAASEMAVIAKRLGLARALVVDVITDYHAEPAWVAPEIDRYVTADETVAGQLTGWGAPAERIFTCGIPIRDAFRDRADPEATRSADGRPLVLLMGGGMGPTRMDHVAARLCASDVPMRVVALAGRDRAAHRRLSRLRGSGRVSLDVRGWTEDVAALMKAASVLVTKPGGVTIAEALACGVPLVLFDPIPGPEERNAALVVDAGAAIRSTGADAGGAAEALLRDPDRLRATANAARRLARPDAAREAARVALDACARRPSVGPVVILTIRNGAGHTSVASAIAQGLHEEAGPSAMVVDVADYMSPLMRLTHVGGYLWLVRHWPALWARIDRYQKRRPHTSPEWYYRRGCRRLRALVEQLRPSALAATEVGCCEIAALVKRDLGLRIPLVAVNGEYDADRAWVQPEVDLYSVPSDRIRDELTALGAPGGQVRAWGVPISSAFHVSDDREALRSRVRGWLNVTPADPLVLVAGGSEGLGTVEEAAERLLRLDHPRLQVVVLAGRSERLRRRAQALAARYPDRLRVLGWTPRMPELLRAADLLVSKLGHTFDEAVASGLPLVALRPPPGAEFAQYRLVEEWGVGRAVRDLDEMAAVAGALLGDRAQLEAMRVAATGHAMPDAARRISHWIRTAVADARVAGTARAGYARESVA